MQSSVDIMKGLSLDSSLSSIDETVSASEYVECLVALLQPILDARFPGNSAKQRIRVFKDRVNFACPVCGDSMKNNYKKRGNFILKGKYAYYFKCHNCGHASRIDKFFSDFKVNLDLNIVNYIAKGIQDFAFQSNVKYDMSLFLDMESIEKYAIDRQEFLCYFNLKEIKNSPVWSWLKNRMQYDTSKFMYNEKLNHLIILNLTQKGKILGIQKRTFKGPNKYFTYPLSKIYELMKRNPKEVPEEIDMLSQLFNICLIDYSKHVTLFEGPLDSFLFKNSIANAGIHKHFPLDINVRFFYDSDKTGIEKSIEKINEEQEVFLWQKFLNDINAPHRNKWDINDIYIWAKENNIKLPSFENYFSNNPLDIIDI
jgi:predicted RNA-binding Zn-ribbon protein involved in translation (DUF1610 family)